MQFRKCGDKISIRYPTAISSKRSTRVQTCLVSELALRFDTLEDCQILTVIDAVEKTAIESARANRVAAVARAVTRIPKRRATGFLTDNQITGGCATRLPWCGRAYRAPRLVQGILSTELYDFAANCIISPLPSLYVFAYHGRLFTRRCRSSRRW